MNYQFWIPVVISLGSAWFANKANLQVKQQAKESFKNILRDSLKNAKYKIINLEEREYNKHQEKMLIITSIQDNLMYLTYPEEKKKYLSLGQNSKLSSLQIDIDDYLGLIMMNTDSENNRMLAISAIQNYLSNL